MLFGQRVGCSSRDSATAPVRSSPLTILDTDRPGVPKEFAAYCWVRTCCKCNKRGRVRGGYGGEGGGTVLRSCCLRISQCLACFALAVLPALIRVVSVAFFCFCFCFGVYLGVIVQNFFFFVDHVCLLMRSSCLCVLSAT